METKTNVMRILDKAKITYKIHSYGNITNGEEVAKILNQDPNQVFKTIVTISSSQKYYVFCLPVNKTINLKKAAISVKEKRVELIPQKELLPLTGYIHGGCSPIGMKKQFTTTIDSSINNYDSIICSGGHIGYQVELSLKDLSKIIKFNLDNITN